MKYVETNFQTFLKHKLNEKVKIKTKEELNQTNTEEEDNPKEPIKVTEDEQDQEKLSRTKSKKKDDTIDEMISEYRKLQIEWDNLFNDKPKTRK